jgi:prepilin-type N-terminal cleavage/methylation domain-containing protein/prepilin-type processing-associated H-X9-DG protein
MLTNRSAARGFTLTELLLVITVIAILAAIAYPVLTGVQERARVTQDMNNLRQIGLATQMYLNDNDGVLFSAAATWTSQLRPKYLPAWKIFQSPFDQRSALENDATSPVSYGINGNSIVGTAADKISKPSIFILFAPAQASGTTVTFQGTPSAAAPGVTVLGIGTNQATSSPGGIATGGTHNSRKRVNALFADLHSENMLWSVFTNNSNSSSDPSAAQRWSP